MVEVIVIRHNISSAEPGIGSGERKRIEPGTKPGAAGISGNGFIYRLTVQGHAGYATHGEDIVCAAASAIIYTAAGALEELCGASADCITERDGYFEINVPVFKDAAAAHNADIIMETAYIGFKQIEASYPDNLSVSGDAQ